MDYTDRINRLTEQVSCHLSQKRFLHVVSVYETAMKMADDFELTPAERFELACGALLHDITREISTPGQLELCKRYHIQPTPQDLRASAVLHAITGAEQARTMFPEVVTHSVYGMIRRHCTGCAGMTLSEKIVFLADYTEPTRRYQSCRDTADFYFNGKTDKNPYIHLDKTLILSYDNSIEHLRRAGRFIHPDTVRGRNDVYKKLYETEEKKNGG